MNNYLKKLAYIKRELVKLAAPVVDDFTELPNPYEQDIINEFTNIVTDSSQSPSVLTPESRAALGIPDLEYMERRPNSVASMRTMRPLYQWDPNIPVSEEIPVSPQPTSAMPQPKASPRSIITSPNGSRPTQYNQEQLNRIREYQNQLITGLMSRPGWNRKKAEDYLRSRNRYYDVDVANGTITGPRGFENSGRFQKILSGEKHDPRYASRLDTQGYPTQRVAKNAKPANTASRTQNQGGIDPRIDSMTSDHATGNPVLTRVRNAYFN